jgi:hypothetical protein
MDNNQLINTGGKFNINEMEESKYNEKMVNISEIEIEEVNYNKKINCKMISNTSEATGVRELENNSQKFIKTSTQQPIQQDKQLIDPIIQSTIGVTQINEINELNELCEDINKKEKQCDNDYETNDLFIKMKILEFGCFIFTIISISSALIYYELKASPANFDSYNDEKSMYDLGLNFSTILCSVGSLLFSK